ncbi:MAG TPA: hypothetical protein DCE41_09640 [Cytophagales bacterium]|nr:hypothetical protein [Cytophagales bacterium]HAA18400.1 hypothetical protein [Cytophagales bacterium]HAP61448.1 hypothetical protein [Cytophagales bacterium]
MKFSIYLLVLVSLAGLWSCNTPEEEIPLNVLEQEDEPQEDEVAEEDLLASITYDGTTKVWVVIFHPETNALVAWERLLPGRTVNVVRPQGFAEDRFHLAYVYWTDAITLFRSNILYYEDYEPFSTTIIQASSPPFVDYSGPRASIPDVTTNEMNNYSYLLCTDKFQKSSGRNREGQLDFGFGWRNNDGGDFLCLRYGKQTQEFAYQWIPNQGNDSPLIISNEGWISATAETIQLPEGSSELWVSYFKGVSDQGSYHLPVYQPSDQELVYPEIEEFTEGYGFRFFYSLLENGYSLRHQLQQEAAPIENTLAAYDATISPEALDISNGTQTSLVSGEVDYVRVAYEWGDDSSITLSSRFEGYLNPNKPVSFPDLAWPDEIRNEVETLRLFRDATTFEVTLYDQAGADGWEDIKKSRYSDTVIDTEEPTRSKTYTIDR